jgi:hypothetical protein
MLLLGKLDYQSMDPVVIECSSSEKPGRSVRAFSAHSVLRLLFLVQSVLVCANVWFPIFGRGSEPWLRSVLLLVTLAVTLGSFLRVLPLQNVVLAFTVILLISAVAFVLLHVDLIRAQASGSQAPSSALSSLFPWRVPLYWAAAALNARGLARFLLRPWRVGPTYGIWVLAASTLLTVLNVVLWARGLGVVDTRKPANDFQLWPISSWHWVLVVLQALVIAVAITPTLINKRPGQQPPPNIDPLWVALVLILVNFLS